MEFDFDETATRMKKTSASQPTEAKPTRRVLRRREPTAPAATTPAAQQSSEPVAQAPKPEPAKPSAKSSDPKPAARAAEAPAKSRPEPVAPVQTEGPMAPTAKTQAPAAEKTGKTDEPAVDLSPNAAPTETKPEEPTMKPPTTTDYKPKKSTTGGWMGLSPQTTKPRSKTPEGKTRNVNDFRQNATRQAKEQKATGNILAWIGYGLGGFMLLVTVMAVLGGYTLLRMIESQAVTVAELDDKYSAKVAEIRASAEARTQAVAVELADARAEALREREALSKLLQVMNGQLETTQQVLIDTQGELAELQKIVKTEAGRRYRGDINNNAKINRVISRVRKLED